MSKVIVLLVVLIVIFSSCKKDIEFTQDHLDFSRDTILFDTVFTTVGSTTKRLKIYNHNNKPINIDAIELMGGVNSPFRINVDGLSGDLIENIEIPANDSLFAFIEVTLVVNNATNPLVISDSIRFKTNGVNQYVNLDVWGQDAYFHVDALVEGLWANDKPHVLYGTVAVGFPTLDSNLTLIIPAGTQIYCHKDSRLIVYKSTLDIQGSLGNEVVFQGDRLESFYDDVSGQWWGIRFIEANSSTINYAVIKNGSVGLQVDSTQSVQTLTTTNTIIDNHDFFSVNVNAGANVTFDNCLIGKAGICSAYLFAGGEYYFTHTSIVNYWSGSRSRPAFVIKNYFKVENTIFVRPVIAELNNCVVYGGIDDEFEVDTIATGFDNMTFMNNYFKRDVIYDYPGYTNNIWTGNPLFVDPSLVDFRFMAGSVLQNSGNNFNPIPIDLEGNFRDSSPDIGCYEFN